jgi:uncharacterized protein YcfJ
MTKSLLTGIVIGAAVVTAGGAVAGWKMWDRGPTYAEVIGVKPVTETIRTPRQECHDVQVTHQQPSKDPNHVAGTVMGAVVGGLLGHQVGGGSGQTLATVAGAAAGGYTGNRIQNRMQANNTTTATESRCRTVYDEHQKEVGYTVHYRLGDKEGTVQMDHNPGERIPVKGGQLVLDDQGTPDHG